MDFLFHRCSPVVPEHYRVRRQFWIRWVISFCYRGDLPPERTEYTQIQLHELRHDCEIHILSLVYRLVILKDYVDDKWCNPYRWTFSYTFLSHNVVSYSSTDLCESMDHKLRRLSKSPRRSRHRPSFRAAPYLCCPDIVFWSKSNSANKALLLCPRMRF